MQNWPEVERRLLQQYPTGAIPGKICRASRATRQAISRRWLPGRKTRDSNTKGGSRCIQFGPWWYGCGQAAWRGYGNRFRRMIGLRKLSKEG